jgi:hypothetical protein
MPVPTRLDIGVDGVLPDAVSATAYFVVAEGLANAVKQPRPRPWTCASPGTTTRCWSKCATTGSAVPPPDWPDPVALLEQQAESRVPELVPIRYGRMLVSPFAYFRGAALPMASDLAGTPRRSAQVAGASRGPRPWPAERTWKATMISMKPNTSSQTPTMTASTTSDSPG